MQCKSSAVLKIKTILHHLRNVFNLIITKYEKLRMGFVSNCTKILGKKTKGGGSMEEFQYFVVRQVVGDDRILNMDHTSLIQYAKSKAQS